MSELAFNLNGDPFDVPTNAIGWRVRKMKNKGAPEVAYGRNGQPLVLPLEADVDDLRAEVGVPGRYRLDPIDDTSKPIANASAGYVMVHELAVAAPVSSSTALAPLPSASDNVVIEAMRMNAEIARSVVDRFPLMMEAAATLLRAADGAGLPARPPMAVGDDGDDEEDEDNPIDPAFDLNALLTQMVPVIVAGFTSGKLKVPDLASMLDWRKAAKKPKPTTARNDDAVESSAETASLDPSAMARIVAIQAALEPEEVAYVQEVAKELSPAELRRWFDELSKLSVPDALVRVRELIAGKKGCVS